MIKKSGLLMALLALATTGPLYAGAPEWNQVPEILRRIVPPVFPPHDWVITDFGAVGDGTNDASEAIHRAVATCAQQGGGRVIIPAGVFLTGPIQLPGGVNLHLETNATLRFKTDSQAYLPAVFTRFEGIECYNYSPLIYARGQTNVAITGAGTLDGQATDETWLGWRGRKTALPGTQTAARKRLDTMNNEQVPVSERRFGAGDFLRPDFIQFNGCRGVLIEGVRIRRSPMWELHPLLCTNVTVRGVDIFSHGANNDGCDPESCRDVLIENCVFDTGDDCISINSGRNNDGRRVGVTSENLIIRHCLMRDGHAGTAIGSEISGGCSNVFIEDCNMSSSNLLCALRLKSNAMRGGVEQNIFMRNVQVGRVADSVLQINFLYEEGARGAYPPGARNIVLENITVEHTPRVLNVTGFPAARISGIRIFDSTFKQIAAPDAVTNAGVQFVNCSLERRY